MNNWLNLILNRFSMYRLSSITLACIWGFAVVLSVLGLLPYSPVALLASGSVLILAAYLSNILFAWLFNVQGHHESTFISALILFFIFSPTMTVVGLVTLALIAIIAMASKYILAVHGRHIFNPAAIAAVIISLTGITYTTWWVATPVLLPVTLACAFLILYKTRRLMLAGVFFAITIPIIVLTYVMNGQSVIEGLTALPSWPLLFFAGFMLSEPLTLPPRHWQQYLIAGIVAVLFAVPLHVGIISGSPVLALVLGNAAAFFFSRRARLDLVFEGSRQLTPSTYEYIFRPKNPLTFIAGQYMEITVPHPHKDSRGIRRAFSIISAPDEPTVRFGIKMYDQPSSFKRTLATLKRGSTVTGTGINGDFVLPGDTDIPLLFIAGGIGITPFISHLHDMKYHSHTRNITLIYAVTDINDIAYVADLHDSGIKVIIATNTNQPLPIPTWAHANTDRLTANEVATHVPDAASRRAYISGPPAMVDATKKIMRDLGVPHTKTDYFTGY